MKPNRKLQNFPPRRGGLASSTGSTTGVQPALFAFDHAARDVIGHRIDDHGNVVRLREHDATKTAVLNEAVDALVASHQDMRDDVDPQPRRLALADAAVEQVDMIRHLREQQIQRLVQNLQPRDLRRRADRR